jgi:hypothetical protein
MNGILFESQGGKNPDSNAPKIIPLALPLEIRGITHYNAIVVSGFSPTVRRNWYAEWQPVYPWRRILLEDCPNNTLSLNCTI